MHACMAKWEDDEDKVATAMDSYWKGMVDLFNAHDPSDMWLDCDETPEYPQCFWY